MVVCPGPYPWYQFLHSIVTSQTPSACRYIDCSKLSFFLFSGFFNEYPPIISLILSKLWGWRLENIAVNPNFRRYIRTNFCFTKDQAEVRKQALLFIPALFGGHIRRNLHFTEKEAWVLKKIAHVCLSTFHPNFWSVFRALVAPF